MHDALERNPFWASPFDACSIEIVILGGLKSFSRDSEPYECLDNSQNADSRRVFEMSRHSVGGETFQRRV
jgi:hypothetical protein